MNANKALQRMTKTVNGVSEFHKIVGSKIAVCSWNDYVESMVVLVGADRADLEALHRIGRFSVSASDVWFHG